MPNLVQILPAEIANRIAAGEVVERPSSVVKELVENAIDAGANRISVDVGAGGKENIRVSDNGSGMSQDDALLALERHSTSKIRDLSDLRSLRTHGFRGEALPSIAAVSRMTIETRLEDSLEGSRISIEGGQVKDVTSTGRGKGTTITLHGLFFNVPARRKFLKGTETEMRHIVNAVTAMALAYPEIAFILTHNGREILNLGQMTLERRIEDVHGVRVGKDAVYVDGGDDGLRVTGYTGRPETARKSGAPQSLIVNCRWVQHKSISAAIYEGYGGLLPKGLFPGYSIFLEVDPARLDVNVHPSKREVRFADERIVYDAVVNAVSEALRASDLIPELPARNLIPEVVVDMPTEEFQQESYVLESPSTRQSQVYRPSVSGIEREPQLFLPLESKSDPENTQDKAETIDTAATEANVAVWQLHQKYILAHTRNGIIIIDQNVAHQRILYEQVLDNFKSTAGTGQRLLFPLTIDFGLKEIQAVREVIPLLEKIGFGIRDFGGNTVVVDAIPVNQNSWLEGKLLSDIVDDLLETERRTEIPPAQQDRQISVREHLLAASYSRHAAIQPDETLSAREMHSLIDQLFATRDPFVCPTGRPTVIKMGLEEIDRRFGR